MELTKISGLNTKRGTPYLYGTTLTSEGCNFTIFSKSGYSVTLLLFDHHSSSTPTHLIPLDRNRNRTGDVWHIFIEGIKEGQYYGYIVDGPYTPEKDGNRFNMNKLLIDPYAKGIGGCYHWNITSAYGYIKNSPLLDISFSWEKNYDIEAKSMVLDSSDFDWGDDKQLMIPLKDTIIYEAHVRSLTQHPSSNSGDKKGTFLGVIEKIPHLKELGITTLELLPVFNFNEEENLKHDPISDKKLKQYWGYSPLSFFAPANWYSTSLDGKTAVYEFKTMVKELHKAGIEVILDVVYNHTGEGNETGPTLSFRGLDNSIYYMLQNGRYYKNYSGCGNTLNCNHPVVKQLILDSLRYWVVDMHVDGFRFDLAAILGRDQDGNWMPNHSVLSDISKDPILSNTKIIAEGWDAAGLYAVGGFPSRWAEWNGKFRDDIRAFIKGDGGKTKEIAKRITGSADIFEHSKGLPHYSINFVTAHDGFTLNDLVSYNNKHNFRNGENGQDGENHNLSWNCGVEGDSDDPDILKLREQQMRNFFLILMISQGTPMILSGDEFKRGQKGNNNTYCQDNELNWIDWKLKDKNRDFFEFCKYMINFRKKHPSLRRNKFFTGVDNDGNRIKDISWHGVEPCNPDWSEDSRSLAFMIDGSHFETGAFQDDNNIYVALNSYWDDLTFKLPKPRDGKNWYIAVDTSTEKGFYWEHWEKLIKNSVVVKSRSSIILIDK